MSVRAPPSSTSATARGLPRDSRVLRHVGDVDDLLGRDDAAEPVLGCEIDAARASPTSASAGGDAVHRDGAEASPSQQQQTCRTWPRRCASRILQHRLEHRLQLARRAGDDLAAPREVAVCCSSDFGEIVGALAQFVEQPRVLDGDDGLGGEVLHQLDLLVGERAHLLAVDGDGADQLVVLEHRHARAASGRRRVQRRRPRRDRDRGRPDRRESRRCGRVCLVSTTRLKRGRRAGPMNCHAA